MGWAGPTRVKAFPVAYAGSKKGRPWMWSQWKWVKQRNPWTGVPEVRRVRPSSRRPVPPSQMYRSSTPETRTSTQGVLPPYPTASLEAVGIEPRTPQNRMEILRASRSRTVLSSRSEENGFSRKALAPTSRAIRLSVS